MAIFSLLALVLLTLVGYSSGAVIRAPDKRVVPSLFDLLVIILLWTGAILTRGRMGQWTAVFSWLLIGGVAGAVMTTLRQGSFLPRESTPLPSRANSPFRRLWDRWVIFGGKMGNFQSRVFMIIFYFTVFLPFGFGATLFSDKLRMKKSEDSAWMDGLPGSTALDKAKRQF